MPTDVKYVLDGFSQRLMARKIDVLGATSVLDEAAQRASWRHPDLWCSREIRTATEAMRLAEKDPVGAAAAVAAWDALGVCPGTAASAAAALWKLARCEVLPDDPLPRSPSARLILRVYEQAVQELMRRPHSPSPSPRRRGRSLQARLFEVIFAAGVEPDHAFAVLDRRGTGVLSCRDFVSTLRSLGLSLQYDELMAASGNPAKEGAVNISEFVWHYRRWLEERSEPLVGLARPSRLLPPPPPIRGSAVGCFNLPCFVIFALLDTRGSGRVCAVTAARFAHEYLGVAHESWERVAALEDRAAASAISYRDFQRYWSYFDREWAARRPDAEISERQGSRSSVRVAVELVSDDAHAEDIVADVLQRRGRTIEDAADAAGLSQLLADLRFPSGASQPLLDGHHAAQACLRSTQSEDCAETAASLDVAAVSYRMLLGTLRRARALVRGHLEVLYSTCMRSSPTNPSVDLARELEFALRRPDQCLKLEELASALQKRGVQLAAHDLEAVKEALDPFDRDCLFAPEVVKGQVAFTQRFKALLGTLKAGLGRCGLSPDELFARVASATAASVR